MKVLRGKMLVKSEQVLNVQEVREASSEQRIQPPEEALVEHAADGLRWISLVPWLQYPSFLYCFKQ